MNEDKSSKRRRIWRAILYGPLMFFILGAVVGWFSRSIYNRWSQPAMAQTALPLRAAPRVNTPLLTNTATQINTPLPTRTADQTHTPLPTRTADQIHTPLPTRTATQIFSTVLTATAPQIFTPDLCSQAQVGEEVTCRMPHAYCSYQPLVSGSPTFCNDAPYPTHAFTLLRWGEDWSYLDGKCLLVTGSIALYQGKLQIVAESISQVQVCP